MAEMPDFLTSGCQICGGHPHAWSEIAGIGTVAMCHHHRHEWHALMVRTLPGLNAELQVATARWRRMMSGFPFTSGINEDQSVAEEYIRMEGEVLTVWEEFVNDQRAVVEEAKRAREETTAGVKEAPDETRRKR